MPWRYRTVVVVVAIGLVASWEAEKRQVDVLAWAPRPSCEAEVESLRAFLDDVTADGYVSSESVPTRDDPYRFLSRPLPIVPLVRVDESPKSCMNAATISLDRGQARFGDDSARTSDAGALETLLRRAAGSSLSPNLGIGHIGDPGSFYEFHAFAIFIAEREPWADATRLFDAAVRAGFLQIEFVFEANARAVPPRDSFAKRRMIAIATDERQMPWQRDVTAAKELARRNSGCPDLAKPLAKQALNSIETHDQLQRFVRDTPNTFRACACRGDPEAIKAYAWIRFGRHWGPTTVTYEVALAAPAALESRTPIEIVAGTAGTPWRKMSAAVIDASRKMTPVRFVVR